MRTNWKDRDDEDLVAQLASPIFHVAVLSFHCRGYLHFVVMI